jgi:hypothetical protein
MIDTFSFVLQRIKKGSHNRLSHQISMRLICRTRMTYTGDAARTVASRRLGMYIHGVAPK